MICCRGRERRHRSRSTFIIISHLTLECWIYLNLKRNSLQKPDFFCFQIHSSDFYFMFLRISLFHDLKFESLEKSHFIEFSFPLFSSLDRHNFHSKFECLLKSCWCFGFTPLGRRAIRLVKRRVEKHQQHSITHTSFTEKYVSNYPTEQIMMWVNTKEQELWGCYVKSFCCETKFLWISKKPACSGNFFLQEIKKSRHHRYFEVKSNAT